MCKYKYLYTYKYLYEKQVSNPQAYALTELKYQSNFALNDSKTTKPMKLSFKTLNQYDSMTNICLFGLIKLNANHRLVSWKKYMFYTEALEQNESLFGSLSC